MLIIDGDLYIYKLGFAYKNGAEGFKVINTEIGDEKDLGLLSRKDAESLFDDLGFDPFSFRLESYRVEAPVEYVIGNLKKMLNSLLMKFNTSEYKLYLTASDYSNYRYEIATIKPYKGTRRKCIKCDIRCDSRFEKNKKVVLSCKTCGDINEEITYTDRPPFYKELREYLVKHWNAEMVTGQEADDAVSIAAVDCYNNNKAATMVHIDKDINNTPGVHFNPDKDELYNISVEQALYNFYSQFLLGDNIDCIPGVKGAGPVACSKLFDSCQMKEHYERVILQVYQGIEEPVPRFKNKMSLTESEAITRLTEIGQLLHIRQKEGELWSPHISEGVI